MSLKMVICAILICIIADRYQSHSQISSDPANPRISFQSVLAKFAHHSERRSSLHLLTGRYRQSYLFKQHGNFQTAEKIARIAPIWTKN